MREIVRFQDSSGKDHATIEAATKSDLVNALCPRVAVERSIIERIAEVIIDNRAFILPIINWQKSNPNKEPSDMAVYEFTRIAVGGEENPKTFLVEARSRERASHVLIERDYKVGDKPVQGSDVGKKMNAGATFIEDSENAEPSGDSEQGEG